jgi:hypothetical protein
MRFICSVSLVVQVLLLLDRRFLQVVIVNGSVFFLALVFSPEDGGDMFIRNAA